MLPRINHHPHCDDAIFGRPHTSQRDNSITFPFYEPNALSVTHGKDELVHRKVSANIFSSGFTGLDAEGRAFIVGFRLLAATVAVAACDVVLRLFIDETASVS